MTCRLRMPSSVAARWMPQPEIQRLEARIKQRLAAECHQRFNAVICAYLANRFYRDIRIDMPRSRFVTALRTMLASPRAGKCNFKLYSFKIFQVFVHFPICLFPIKPLQKSIVYRRFSSFRASSAASASPLFIARSSQNSASARSLSTCMPWL